VSAKAEIVALSAPVEEAALDQLADVLVDCVEGGASVSFMSPFSHDQGLGFFRRVAGSVAAGDTVLLAARLDGNIVGTVQLGLDTPPNQPHRADVKKMLVHRGARGRGIGALLMGRSKKKRAGAADGFWCSIPCLVKTATGFICGPAGRKRASCPTTRCFRMAGPATPPSCGSGWMNRRMG
jgi:GNAT superfamily N-acetyltransferase